MGEIICIPLALLRLAEPFVYYEIFNQCRNFAYCIANLCCMNKYKRSKSQIFRNDRSDSLDSFLNKSCNIEFVSLILLGINNFMDLQKHLYEIENQRRESRRETLKSEQTRKRVCCCCWKTVNTKCKKIKIDKSSNHTKFTFCNIEYNNID